MSSTTPLVSISCITYNQGKYLRQCLDGFLSQERDFDIEILLHDDASTDETPQIIQEYTTRYPDIIFPVIQKENQYSKGVRGMMPRFNFPRARGKYIALCEGDDWWLDTRKLQKQVEALESNPEYVLCFHPVVIMNEAGLPEGKDTITLPQQYETLENLAEFGNYIHTPTVMFRNVIQDYPVQALNVSPIGDFTLYLYLAQFGKLFRLPDPMSAYRKSVGVWSSQSVFYRHFQTAKTFAALQQYFETKNPTVADILKRRIASFMKRFKSEIQEEQITVLHGLFPAAQQLWQQILQEPEPRVRNGVLSRIWKIIRP